VGLLELLCYNILIQDPSFLKATFLAFLRGIRRNFTLSNPATEISKKCAVGARNAEFLEGIDEEHGYFGFLGIQLQSCSSRLKQMAWNNKCVIWVQSH
jgi:hypothetical protein